jgi:hypothetical protein
MTLEEFQNKFKRNKRFDKYWYRGLCIATISFSLFMLYSLATNSTIIITGNKTFHFFGFLSLFLFGIYGLFVLRRQYNLSYWHNDLPKEKNLELLNSVCSELMKSSVTLEDNQAYFVYRKSWWRMPYEVFLFADNKIIAINVEGLDLSNGGFIDFGASKRTRNKILLLFKEKAEKLNNRPA